jgi:predicted metal-dependent TIM-barrel fold hydrolase
MEHDYLALTEIPHRKTSVEAVREQIRAVDAERCIIASDTGQKNLPDLITGMKSLVTALLESGISDHEVDFMARRNPRILLDVSSQ